MAQWVNFKELREKLDFENVLKEYQVEIKIKNGQATGFCPLPSHDGNKHSPSFSVNLGRGIWQCFGCGAKGNVLEFALKMEGLNPDDVSDFRKGALRIQERFGITTSKQKENEETKKPILQDPQPEKKSEPKKEELPRRVNTPLDFTLKGLDPKHPYLKGRGFTEKTIEYFGLGHCNRGLMKNRIGIPLHDFEGQLIGYAGRLIDDSAVSAEAPKYLFPGEREREGVIYEFRKSLFVYNAHRIEKPQDIIIVEGFPAVWWLWQIGCPNVAALMGSSCSDEQAEMIKKFVPSDGHIWILSDGDGAGERCALDLLAKLSPFRFVRWIKLESGRQPTDCGPQELAALFNKNQQ